MGKSNADLLERVQPLIDEVDLEHDLTEHIEYVAAVAAMGGTEPTDVAKKLLLLKQRGQITSAEYLTMIREHYQLKPYNLVR